MCMYLHILLPLNVRSRESQNMSTHSICLWKGVCVQMCINSTGRHGQLSGVADNSLKCCSQFHVLMKSTAEKLLAVGPCMARPMTDYWCSQLLALQLLSLSLPRVKEKTETVCVCFCLSLIQDGKKILTIYIVQTRWTKLGRRESCHGQSWLTKSSCMIILHVKLGRNSVTLVPHMLRLNRGIMNFSVLHNKPHLKIAKMWCNDSWIQTYGKAAKSASVVANH